MWKQNWRWYFYLESNRLIPPQQEDVKKIDAGREVVTLGDVQAFWQGRKRPNWRTRDGSYVPALETSVYKGEYQTHVPPSRRG